MRSIQSIKVDTYVFAISAGVLAGTGGREPVVSGREINEAYIVKGGRIVIPGRIYRRIRTGNGVGLENITGTEHRQTGSSFGGAVTLDAIAGTHSNIVSKS